MSSGAIEAWHATVTPQLLEAARQHVEPRHRTTTVNMALIGLHLSVAHRSSRGYCNETHQQIFEGVHGVLTLDTISRTLRCLDFPGLWQIVKPGGKGSPTQRVLTSFDPHDLIASHGDISPRDVNQSHGATTPRDDAASHGDKSSSHGDTHTIARGLDRHRMGVSPLTPKQSPKDLPKYSPTYPESYDA